MRVVATYPNGVSMYSDLKLFRRAATIVGGDGIGGGSCDLRTGLRTNDWHVELQEDAELLKATLLQCPIKGLEVKIVP